MSSIDDRIVNMQFNNSQFESGVKETLDSLGKLDKSVNATGKNDSMNSLGNLVDQLGSKFSVLETIATGALLRIGSQIEQTVQKLATQLTTAQIGSGWQKYADIATSSATLIATGNSQEDVDSLLKELNWYADSTSASLSDMTSNIGKFVAAGQGLDESAIAVMGISNWAYESGQNIQNAGRAMYNLSQALSAGAVKLIDWKSIQNANMDTREFRETVLETAASIPEIGRRLNETDVVINGVTVNADNFTSTLADGWFTSELLMATLTQYGGTVGEVFEYASENALSCAEAMAEMTEQGLISMDSIGAKSLGMAMETKTFQEAINATADAVSTAWLNIFTNVFGNYTEAKEVWTQLADILWDVFASPIVAIQDITAEMDKFGAFEFIIKGLVNYWDIFAEKLSTVGSVIGRLLPDISAIDLSVSAATFLSGSHDGGQFVEILDSIITVITKVVNALGLLKANFLAAFSEPISTFLGGIGPAFQAGLSTIADLINNLTWAFGNINVQKAFNFDEIGENLTNFVTGLQDLWAILNSVASALGTALQPVLSVFFELIGYGVNAISDFVGWIGTLLTSFREWLDESGALETAATAIADAVRGIRNSVADFLDEHKDEITNFIESVKNGFLTLVDTVWPALQSFGQKVSSLFSSIFGGGGNKAGSSVDEGSMPVLFEENQFAEAMTGEGQNDESAAARILTSLKSIGESVLPILQTIFDIVVQMLPLVTEAIAKVAEFIDNLLVLVEGVLTDISDGGGLNFSSILALAGGIGAIITVINLLKGSSSDAGDGDGSFLGSVIGGIKGLFDISKNINGVVKAFRSLVDGLSLLTKAVSLTVIAAGLYLLSEALVNVATIPFDQLMAGTLTMLALGAGLVILAKAIDALQPSLSASAAMLVLAAAIGVLAVSLALLANFTFGELASGLGIIALALVGMLVAAAVAQEIALGLVVLTAAFVGLGAAVALMGVGAMAFASAVDTIVDAILKFADVDAGALSNICNAIVKIVEAMVVSAVNAVLTFFNELAVAAPQIAEDVITIVDSICTAIEAIMPRIIEVPYTILISVLDMLNEKVPEIVEKVMTLITNILNAITQNLPNLIQAGVDLLIAIMNGFVSARQQLLDAAFDAIIQMITGMAETIDEKMPLLIEAMKTLANSIINAAILIITGGESDFADSGEGLMSNGLMEGIKNKITALCEQVKDALAEAKQKVTDKISEWKQAGKDLLDGLIQGIKDKVLSLCSSVTTAVSSAVSSAKSFLKINSPSKVFEEIGMYTMMGLAVGVEENGYRFSDATTDALGEGVDAMSTAMQAAMDAVSDDELTIRPVIDLSGVDEGISSMNDTFARSSFSVAGSANLASSYGIPRSSGAFQNGQNTTNNTSNISINVYGAEGQNVEELADIISQRLNAEVDRKRAVFAL